MEWSEGVTSELHTDKGVMMRNVATKIAVVNGRHLVLRVGSQGYSYAESWEHGTLKHDRVNWGYLDYPYYKRSYEIPWWSTQQIYTEATLRWLDIPYVACF